MCTVWHQTFVAQNFRNFHDKRSIMKLFTTNIWCVIDAITQLNFSSVLRHLPQVGGPLSHKVSTTAISAVSQGSDGEL